MPFFFFFWCKTQLICIHVKGLGLDACQLTNDELTLYFTQPTFVMEAQGNKLSMEWKHWLCMFVILRGNGVARPLTLLLPHAIVCDNI